MLSCATWHPNFHAAVWKTPLPDLGSDASGKERVAMQSARSACGGGGEGGGGLGGGGVGDGENGGGGGLGGGGDGGGGDGETESMHKNRA